MNALLHLQELNDLIVANTKPPVTAMLRNKLTAITEQVEAYQASADKQDETLARQVETIERLMNENQALIAEQKRLELKGSDQLQKLGEEHINLLLSRQINQ